MGQFEDMTVWASFLDLCGIVPVVNFIPQTSAETIAEALLARFGAKGFTMSNLKLQKLLYYVQGHHLAAHGQKAFVDSIKAWAHGPVVPGVYHRYKGFSWNDIFEIPQCPELPQDVSATVDLVLEKYGSFTAFELEEMTHAESPWISARKGIPLGAPASPEMGTCAIKDHFLMVAAIE